jgi:hypothetical protein
MSKEVIMVCFEILPLYLPGDTVDNYKKILLRTASHWVENQTQKLPNIKQEQPQSKHDAWLKKREK